MRSGGLHSRIGRDARVNGIQGNSLSPAVWGQIGGTIYEPGWGSPQPPNLQVPWCGASNHRIFEKSIPVIAKLPSDVFCFVVIAAQTKRVQGRQSQKKTSPNSGLLPREFCAFLLFLVTRLCRVKAEWNMHGDPQQPPTALFVLRQGFSVQP